MSHLELNELTQVEKFFDEFKLKEAIESLDDLIQLNDINHQQKSFYQYLRGQILLWQGKYEEAINWGKKIFQESQDFNERLQSIDGLSIIITGLIQSDKFDEAKNFIEQAENLLRSISHVSENDLMERKVRIKVARAHLNCNISNIASALECLEWVLSIQKELDNQFEFAYNDIYKYSFVYTNILMAYVMIYVKSRYDLGMEYTKNALAIAENMNFNHMGISLCQFYFGLIYSATGEIDLSLKSYLKSLTIFKKLENRLLIGGLKNNIFGREFII
jgi:tetratricopeptide (TPR) repeat protein